MWDEYQNEKDDPSCLLCSNISLIALWCAKIFKNVEWDERNGRKIFDKLLTLWHNESEPVEKTRWRMNSLECVLQKEDLRTMAASGETKIQPGWKESRNHSSTSFPLYDWTKWQRRGSKWKVRFITVTKQTWGEGTKYQPQYGAWSHSSFLLTQRYRSWLTEEHDFSLSHPD